MSIQTATVLKYKENSILANNRLLDYADIDQTLETFLTYFQKDFIPSLDLSATQNKRLTLKNIGTLYKQKGTAESIKFLMRILYGLNSEVKYPIDETIFAGKNDYDEDRRVFVQMDSGEFAGVPKATDRIVQYSTADVNVITAEAIVEQVLIKNVNNREYSVKISRSHEGIFEHNRKVTFIDRDGVTKYDGTLKDAGITVYHAVPSLDGAIKAANAGVDGLVVEGTEGGGFKSPIEVGLLVLIQSIKQNLDLPIIAAGGIADGAGMAAVFAAGAEGIQMGTRFVSSLESPVHDNFKNKIINSGIDGTYILNKKSKPVIRALKTDLTKDIDEKGEMDMTALMNIKDLYFGGDMEAAPALSGQSSGLIDEIKSVKQIIDEIVKEFNTICDSMSELKI